MFQTIITSGPTDGGLWGPDPAFRWESPGAERFRWALLTKEEYLTDLGVPFTTARALVWADTLTFHPDLNGGYDTDRPAWEETGNHFARVEDLPGTTGDGAPHLYLFGVRAFDETGVEDLSVPDTFRRFAVSEDLAGPRIALVSDVAGAWQAGDPVVSREVFAGNGLRFEWSALPGLSQAPPLAFSFAVDDSSQWAPLSPDLTSWPRGDDVWRPAPGPHVFWVKAVDEGGFVSVLEARLVVFDGPRGCAETDILVVLDTNPVSMVDNGLWPPDYGSVERALVDGWLAGYDYRVFETGGSSAPAAADLDCASSVLWLHSTDVGSGDSSVLESFHRGGSSAAGGNNLLRSWTAAGGNLFLCGVQPVQAMRAFEVRFGAPQLQVLPVVFETTLTDPTYVPHWAVTRLGIGRIDATVGNTVPPSQGSLRLTVATSSLPGEYPDLPFDPLRWPDGQIQGGFGFYDRGVQPLAGSGAEVVYTVNDTGIPLAVRRLTHPGPNGNVFFLALHPYFVLEPSFVELLDDVLDDFGEAPVAGLRRSAALEPRSRR